MDRIKNLGGYAHAPKNIAKPSVRQTRPSNPKMLGKTLGPKAKDHHPVKRK